MLVKPYLFKYLRTLRSLVFSIGPYGYSPEGSEPRARRWHKIRSYTIV
jgi:hypothetical protein